MQYLKLSLISLFLFLNACQSPEIEPRTMTRRGAVESEIRRADEIEKKLSSTEGLEKQSLTKEEISRFSTEFAFWQEIDLYLKDDQIQVAQLRARPKDTNRYESFYYDRDGHFILGLFSTQNEPDQRYYFLIDKLILALDVNKDTLELKSSKTKLTAIGLVDEASKLKKIAHQKARHN